MPVLQLYGDDSGTREYDPNRNYETSGKSRYFVYGALLMEERDASLFVARLRELKQIVFGTADVEVKSNWLRMPMEAEKRYLQPFHLTPVQLTAFVDDYYRLIDGAPLRFLGSIVDKLHMQETYESPREPWYAPTVAYEVLLQRAVQATPSGSTLTVTMDDISGRTPKRNEYKRLLGAHHERLRKLGSSLQKSISFACLQTPARFMNSAHSDLLQVADVAAYNLYRQFRTHGDAWELAVGPLPTYEHFKRIARKFHQGPNGRIQGFGVAKFPLKNRVVWVLTPKKKNVAAP